MKPGEPFVPYQRWKVSDVKHRKDAASVLPFGLVRSRLVSLQACMTWAYLAHRASYDGVCFPSVYDICVALNFSERQVRTQINELRKAGLISTVRKGDGPRHPNHYTFHWHASLETVDKQTLKGATSRTLATKNKGAESRTTRVRDSVEKGCEIPHPTKSVSHPNKKDQEPAAPRSAVSARFPQNGFSADGLTDEHQKPKPPDSPLIDRLHPGDLDALATFVQTQTGQRCSKDFTRDIAKAAREAPAMDDLLNLFRQKIAAGHGPKKGNGWFRKVAADHFGGEADPEDVLGSGEFGPLTRSGVPKDFDEYQRWDEWKKTGVIPPRSGKAAVA